MIFRLFLLLLPRTILNPSAMKRILLSLFIVLSCAYFATAQTVEIIGIGTLGKTTANLSVSDAFFVDSVNVGTFYKGPGAVPSVDAVQFYDTNEPAFSNWSTDMIIKHPGNPSGILGYHYGTFKDVDGSGINASITITDNTHSFYGFVTRNKLTSDYKSTWVDQPVFMYHNGSQDPYQFVAPIDKVSESRSVRVHIPITELDDTDRMVKIEIEAGPVSLNITENTYNLDNSFFLGTYTLDNVPGYVDEVKVTIYSPNRSEGNGDSFFISGIVVDADKIFNGCTYTQGYWKTHSTCKEQKGNGKGPERDPTWDELENAENTTFFLAVDMYGNEMDYCQVFDAKPNESKYYILAHQYIAAELNLLNDADPADVSDAFDEATEFLSTYDQEDVNQSSDLQADCVRLGGILDEFNNGVIGPGHCDEHEYEAVTPIKMERQKVALYPNPVSSIGTISFKAGQGGKTTVELYNISGQRIGVLFDGKTSKNDEISIQFDTSAIQEGIYFALIKNGTDMYRKKVSISK